MASVEAEVVGQRQAEVDIMRLHTVLDILPLQRVGTPYQGHLGAE